MSRTKQFRIAVQNHPGAVAEIARMLGDAKVNILALLGTARGTAGALVEYLEKLAAKSVSLNSIYATAHKDGKSVTVVYSVEAEGVAAVAKAATGR